MVKEKKLRYKHPLYIILAIPLFIVGLGMVVVWHLVVSILFTIRIVQAFLVIEEDEPEVRKKANKLIDTMKMRRLNGEK